MSVLLATEFDCGRCDPGCRCLEPEPPTEYCIGHCHQQIEIDPDDPDFVPFCGSSSCRSYAEAEYRAEQNGARI